MKTWVIAFRDSTTRTVGGDTLDQAIDIALAMCPTYHLEDIDLSKCQRDDEPLEWQLDAPSLF